MITVRLFLAFVFVTVIISTRFGPNSLFLVAFTCMIDYIIVFFKGCNAETLLLIQYCATSRPNLIDIFSLHLNNPIQFNELTRYFMITISVLLCFFFLLLFLSGLNLYTEEPNRTSETDQTDTDETNSVSQ